MRWKGKGTKAFSNLFYTTAYALVLRKPECDIEIKVRFMPAASLP